MPLKVTTTYLSHRWSGRGPVTLGGGASSPAGELGRERGIIGNGLITSKETCKDNLRDGMRNKINADLLVIIYRDSVCYRSSLVAELQRQNDSWRTGARSFGLFRTQQYLKRVKTSLSNEPMSVWVFVCVCMGARVCMNEIIKWTMIDCILYTTIFVWFIWN